MNCGDLPFLHIIVATIAAFALGAVWYSVLFGRIWMKELGFTQEQMRGSNMPLIFGTTLILTFIMALGLAMLLYMHGDPNTLTCMHGLHIGLMAGLMFVATSIGINYLYQRKSMTLWLIDATYQVLFMGLIGAILGGWH